MDKTADNIQLKGYVGGADFDRNAVDKTLAEYSGKPVNVLIDSLPCAHIGFLNSFGQSFPIRSQQQVLPDSIWRDGTTAWLIPGSSLSIPLPQHFTSIQMR